MTRLTDADKRLIREAIVKAESKSSGELVTVIARSSDDYLYIPLLWSAIVALCVPLLMWLPGAWPSYENLYLAQLTVFFGLAAVFRLDAIKMKLIPRSVKHRRASRTAREQFFQQNLHHTEGRTGILIFVSLAEHYVEIIADKGINDVVPEHAWEQAVADFLKKVKAGQLTEGFVAAVEDCGKLLSQHFPADRGNANELPNHLVEL